MEEVGVGMYLRTLVLSSKDSRRLKGSENPGGRSTVTLSYRT